MVFTCGVTLLMSRNEERMKWGTYEMGVFHSFTSLVRLTFGLYLGISDCLHPFLGFADLEVCGFFVTEEW